MPGPGIHFSERSDRMRQNIDWDLLALLVLLMSCSPQRSWFRSEECQLLDYATSMKLEAISLSLLESLKPHVRVDHQLRTGNGDAFVDSRRDVHLALKLENISLLNEHDRQVRPCIQ